MFSGKKYVGLYFCQNPPVLGREEKPGENRDEEEDTEDRERCNKGQGQAVNHTWNLANMYVSSVREFER